MSLLRRPLTAVALLAAAACHPAPSAPAPLPFWAAPHAPRDSAEAEFPAAIRFLDSAVASGAAPGAVLGVSWHGHRWYHGTGRLGIGDPTVPDSATLYDMASVTKVTALTPLVLEAVAEGKLDLDAPVRRYVPAFGGGIKDDVTVRHLLTHSSGLPAWRPLYLGASTRAAAFALADTTPLDTIPGVRMVYSDLGIIILTQALEGIYGHRLDTLATERVFAPLGMRATRYLPPANELARIAPTELDTTWRHRMLRGEVHDENASRLDGVSGHAGLFSDAADMVTYGEWWLALVHGTGGASRGASDPAGAAARSALAADFIRPQGMPPGSTRAIGWDTPGDVSSSGHYMSARSFGHTGFTGTSIWIDPTRDLVIVLLSNRVHPTRANQNWGVAVRGGVADRVLQVLDPGAPPRASVDSARTRP
ncbi:MAG TPA: serine hydrolase domain-containing protein [Gemmatimonadales bacterium]|jgi:CubicO group peptidase (beta-lactamase class C family)|nr:serine hydrolase domain-containing protein [Gemmatimonadales bacterium]